MLPDYPKVKSLISESFSDFLSRRKNEKLGIFSKLEATILHEGSVSHIYRDDGTHSVVEMQHIEASAQLEHDSRQIETLDVNDIFKVLEELADGMALKQHKILIDCLDEACEESGNVVDGKKPFVEQIFEGMEMQYMSFDDDGQLSEDHTFYGGSKAVEQYNTFLQQLDSDAPLRQRYNSLMERKRQEWRDREATRNLGE